MLKERKQENNEKEKEQENKNKRPRKEGNKINKYIGICVMQLPRVPGRIKKNNAQTLHETEQNEEEKLRSDVAPQEEGQKQGRGHLCSGSCLCSRLTIRFLSRHFGCQLGEHASFSQEIIWDLENARHSGTVLLQALNDNRVHDLLSRQSLLV